ncbi:unnamed protein product [Rotaria sp. Silwood1]|nr:unnamed protein product [Rotaria sp. Silwood1]CAF3863447.1 unnamed protein product [Rotaria sp. Silwood1]CAF4877243.1 unnamed protein product [Rotaria sp. Silwood1]
MPEKIHLSLFDVLLVPSLLAASSRKTIPTETVNDPTLLKIVRIRRAAKATTKAATTKAATTKAATTKAATTAAATTAAATTAAATTAAATTIAINNSSTTTSSTYSLFEQQAMTQTNIDRTNYCAAPLTIDPNVTAIARNYSQYLCRSWPVTSWYNESVYYNFSSPGFSSSTGHFTQLVWQSTTVFGISICCISNNTQCYVVANYYPAGNYGNQFAQNVLQPPCPSG